MPAPAIDLGALLPRDLVRSEDLVAEARFRAAEIEVGTTLYLAEKGVRSEIEYRRRAAEQRIPCTAMNIGLATWADTREAIALIHEDSLSRGIRPPDRYELLAERRMGLPPELRESAPPETGPCLWSEQDWWELGNTVPIQPEAGDNTIGGPGSVPNVTAALKAGVTTVGVASQFVWRWPYWDDEVAQIEAVVTAASIIAAKKDQGACLNTYLDDGYCGAFGDYAVLVGWAMLERYVFEQLLGAPFSVSWGGLTADPFHKSAVTLALHRLNPDCVPPAYIQGDTISHTDDFKLNFAAVSVDVLTTKAVCIHYGIAAGVIAVPVTETTRIPSWEEVAEIHAVNRRLEDYLPAMERFIDWRAIETEADRLVVAGRRVFENCIDAMSATGVDVGEPLQVLLAAKRVGADMFERLFSVGEPADEEFGGRRPVLRTDLVAKTIALRSEALADIRQRFGGESLKGRTIVAASTDVHHFALYLLGSALREAGATVVDIGVSRDPEDIVKVAIEVAADAVAVTTHNGVARSFGAALTQGLAVEGCSATVFMGGVLNEDTADSPTPVDVREALWQQGISTPGDLRTLIEQLGAV